MLPRGWKLRERRKNKHGGFVYSKEQVFGLACFETRTIDVVRIETRADLFVFLHEIGHIHCGHGREASHADLSAVHEYEAETWAIRAMRGMGFAVPRSCLAEAKAYVRGLIVDPEQEDPAVVKFAYGADS